MTEIELLKIIDYVKEDGRTYLNLFGNQLTALPPEIGQLINLTTLDLGRNQLTALPHETGLFR